MSQLRSAISHLRSGLLPLLILGYVWFTLINHLRIEWSVNPQYGYGWAVPFLCAFLIWRRARRPEVRSQTSEGRSQISGSKHRPTSQLPTPILSALFALLALAWLPTRLIEEANPEWRLVSWALAVEVIGLTLLLLSESDVRGLQSAVRVSKNLPSPG